ncbi:hypothetical protein [Hydrogenophaga atypica]|uniref:hypothetical protein n=1 Tax=Hydrogenophaga atypica TaxID=249409 RepID=UPI0036D261C1
MKNQCSLEIPSVTVVAKAFRLEQRIGVCVTRGGWDHGFRIKVVNGEIPEKYRTDP